MKPHPNFVDRDIPRTHSLGDVELKALTVDDLVRDYCAVMESAADIRAAHPDSNWPEGLTLEENLMDLAWHQKEFETRRSFAWIIEDGTDRYLGCLYVYPSLSGDNSAEVRWWWRTGVEANDFAFRADLTEWLASSDWPELDYELQKA